MKMPTRLQDLHPLLNSARAELAQRLGRAPSASELAAEVGVSRDDLIVALNAAWFRESPPIDVCDRAHGDDLSLAEAVLAFDRAVAKLSNREALRQVLESLPVPERAAVLLRVFGSMTQTQIAGHLGVSQIQVSRLLAKSLGTIRDKVR